MIWILTVGLLTGIVGCGNGGNTGPSNEPAESEPSEEQPAQTAGAASATAKELVRLGGLKGPTTMGLVQLLESVEQKTALNDYEFTMAPSADGLNPMLIQGELDIAAMPVNLASVLYNNTQGQLKALAVNTLGVLYIIETGESVRSIADLKGKTVYATGKDAVPEFTFKYILQSNGLNPETDLTIEWKTEPTEVVAQLGQGGGIGLLPQPFVTVAQNSLSDLRVALDLTEEWGKLGNEGTLVTGVTVVRTEFAQAHPEAVSRFLDDYKRSADYINAHVEESAQWVEKYDIINANVAVKAIPYCNIVCLEGDEMKEAVQGYLEALYEQNPKSVGGALPDDEFYYQR
jgi:NitT/TauT family transport system substrate-binding protein